MHQQLPICTDISGGDLDAIMMCGDYSSIGNAEQARTLFHREQGLYLMKYLKKKQPKLLRQVWEITIPVGIKAALSQYACQRNGTKYLAEYGLTAEFSDKSDIENGNIRIDIDKNGRQYAFLYVETDWYAENSFKSETLKWLDEMLYEITTENPYRFVFVGMHAPVSESGIYGTDKKLESGADWCNV